MPRKVGAILLDTRSIQKYVFSCNKLKTNVGASYLVDKIFSDLMPQILTKHNLKQPQLKKFSPDNEQQFYWLEDKALFMKDDSSINCEIASVGGGNMLILVDKGDDTEETCLKIVRDWSRELLLRAPGLKTGIAIDTIDIDCSDEEFQTSTNKLFQKLKENQNNILPQVDLPFTGFTLECDYSDKVTSSDTFEYKDSKKRLISKEVKAKTEAFESADDDYRTLLEDEYKFTNEIDNLGYKDGESYICVIHIDGNNMGIKFANARSMQERKKLSSDVAKIVKKSFDKLIHSIMDEYDIYADYLDMHKLTTKDYKPVLPIRPIIIGGDDVTFVCPGRVGLIYAKRFIEFVNEEKLLTDDFHKYVQAKISQTDKNTTISNHLSCCGGIAIVPAKYPFFRAYELAEALCSEAKKKSRAHDDSLIDFAILHGDMYPSIEQLRANQYVGVNGDLHYGPYYVLKQSEDKANVHDLLSLTEKLQHKIPQNKIKKLRSVLTQDEHSIAQFLENSNDIRDILQKEVHKTNISAQDFWQDGRTRYIDAIEIADFLIPEHYQTKTEEA